MSGRTWKVTLPDNTSVTNEYFANGLLKKTYGSRTYPVEYTYDAQGRMQTMKTWQNFAANSGTATTTWYYDVYRGWLTNKVYADGKGTIYTNTAAGRLKSRTWARGINTIYSYNNAGDLSGVDYSDNTSDVANAYDRRGRQTAITQGSITTSRLYNDAGQMTKESYSGGPLNGLSVTNRYDQYLRRTNLALLSGSTVLSSSAYSYDAASRLGTVSDGTNSATYGYLANSALVEQIAFATNGTTVMTTIKGYDALNRLTNITTLDVGSAALDSHRYTYNTANQRGSVTNVDDSRWVYTYDSLGQVTGGKKYWSDSTPVAGQQFEYGFDTIGNRTMASSGGDAAGANLRSQNYSANNLNQYTQRSVPHYVQSLGAANSNATVSLWSAEGGYAPTSRKGEYFRGELAVNNSTGAVWLTLTNLAVLTNGNNPDIITNTVGNAFVPLTPETFGYDVDGNLTNDGRWTLTWDAENRLVAMTSLATAPAGSKRKLEFAYDHQGRRIEKLVSTNNGSSYVAQRTNRFAYDSWNLVATLNPQSAILQSYLWGLDLSGSMQGAGGVGGLLFIGDFAAAIGHHAVAYDGNGNVTALVNAANGTVSANYEYGPFGELIRASGTIAKANPLRFSSKYQDDESDLLYYGYRSYSPTLGRWLSRDPAMEESCRNLFCFVGNNPIAMLDVHGLVSLEFVSEGRAQRDPWYASIWVESESGVQSSASAAYMQWVYNIRAGSGGICNTGSAHPGHIGSFVEAKVKNPCPNNLEVRVKCWYTYLVVANAPKATSFSTDITHRSGASRLLEESLPRDARGKKPSDPAPWNFVYFKYDHRTKTLLLGPKEIRELYNLNPSVAGLQDVRGEFWEIMMASCDVISVK